MARPPHILGISAFYHDSAAALVVGGRIAAAAQEERFSRRKNDESFPHQAINFCLRHEGLHPGALDAVVFYDKPILKFARMLETCLEVAPRGLGVFARVLPGWLGEKLDMRGTIRRELDGLRKDCPILFTEHHVAHAASAFYPSPFERAAILTVDGVGEWATTTIGRGEAGAVELLKEIHFPHSLGLLYSAFTAYSGFRINSGEYKLMGLAPYGQPRYADRIRQELIDLRPDGSYRLNLDYFEFLHGTRMYNERFCALLEGPPRGAEQPIESRHTDVARSVQVVIEEAMLNLARHAREVTGERHLCLAGGVALNCVANGRLLREVGFDQIWIQPAAGDAGGALGAALHAWHMKFGLDSAGRPARTPARPDQMQAALLGPAFSDAEIEKVLRTHGAVYRRLEPDALFQHTAAWLAQEKVVGWFQGRMEFGPRALGNRSILGDPRSPKMQSVMNLKVKFRESFRPFAPVVLRERVGEYFDLEADSPYMLLVAPVREALRKPLPPGVEGLALLKEPRSALPAITHVDYSSRIQTVTHEQNPLLYALVKEFERLTGCGVLVNTSFNVRGEPVVCTPDDAYRCFMNTEMDGLVLGSFVLERAAQPGKPPERRVALQPD